jgi:hypothetical protein
VKVAMVFWTEIPPDRLDQIPTRVQILKTHVLIRILGIENGGKHSSTKKGMAPPCGDVAVMQTAKKRKNDIFLGGLYVFSC